MNPWISFLIGFVAGVAANYAYDWILKKNRGKDSFVDSKVRKDKIFFTGQVDYSENSIKTLTNLTKNVSIQQDTPPPTS
ncbi:hypothetical protein [Saccharicrinis sp. FJH54]|uniref:hypothetical protein n=1 Tax=Saccharicrinis sp. FJH54 TaxID=3344665 RepID=UPI0035D4D0F9